MKVIFPVIVSLEFEGWKEQYEKSTKPAFNVSKVKITLSGTNKFFNYNCSSSYTSQSTGKHEMKSQGMSKIDFNCQVPLKLN